MSTQEASAPCSNYRLMIMKQDETGHRTQADPRNCIDSTTDMFVEIEEGDSASFQGKLHYEGKLGPNQAVMGFLYFNNVFLYNLRTDPENSKLEKGYYKGNFTSPYTDFIEVVVPNKDELNPPAQSEDGTATNKLPILKLEWRICKLVPNENYNKEIAKQPNTRDYAIPVSAWSSAKKGDQLSFLVKGNYVHPSEQDKKVKDVYPKRWEVGRLVSTQTFVVGSDYSLVVAGKKRYEAGQAASSSNEEATLGPIRAERARKRAREENRKPVDLTI